MYSSTRKRVLHGIFCHVKILVSLSLIISCCLHLSATPLVNVYDTAIIHTARGTDKFYKKFDKGHLRLHLSPFYQHANTARDVCNKKVQLHDRCGKWNLLAILFDAEKAAPTNKPFSEENYEQLWSANSALQGNTLEPSTLEEDRFNFTKENEFKKEVAEYNYGTYTDVKGSYEKLGLRAQINFDFGGGFGTAIRAGFVDIRQKASDYIVNEGVQRGKGIGSVEGAPSQNEAAFGPVFFDNLVSANARTKIANELGIDLSEFCDSMLEDVHVQLYWNVPIKLCEREEVPVLVVPHISLGAWIPSGNDVKPHRRFSVPSGNNNFWGITLEGALNFEFPTLGTDQILQLSLGAGAVFSETKDLKAQRVPTSIYQEGLIPWTTDIKRRPGHLWYANASLKAEYFSGNLMFYFDYIYTQHLKDHINLLCSRTTCEIIPCPTSCESSESSSSSTNTSCSSNTCVQNCTQTCFQSCEIKKILKCTTTTLTKAAQDCFQKGVCKLEDESCWKNQQINFGLTYKIASCLTLGGMVQAHISGRKVLRPVTVLGHIQFSY